MVVKQNLSSLLKRTLKLSLLAKIKFACFYQQHLPNSKICPYPRSLHLARRGTYVVWPDFQPMRVPEEPVCIDLFRFLFYFQFLPSCIWNLPFMSYRLRKPHQNFSPASFLCHWSTFSVLTSHWTEENSIWIYLRVMARFTEQFAVSQPGSRASFTVTKCFLFPASSSLKRVSLRVYTVLANVF
jgi:hypothetical protein